METGAHGQRYAGGPSTLTHLFAFVYAQVFDILWSDPQHNEGCQPNGLRGAGTYFGPDVTHNFLQKYKLEFLVRSHECKQNGYEKVHKEKVIRGFHYLCGFEA